MINALCHRDYTNHAHTQIRLYDNHLEFRNAGSLPPGLTTEMLLCEHDSIPRNRKIAEAFFYAGLIERWGSGTLRMASELKNAGLPEPEFRSSGNNFQLLFYKERYNEEKLMKMGLSDRHIQGILYAKQHGSISNVEYQKLVGVSKRTASRDLTELAHKGLFISEGMRGRGIIYRCKKG